MCRVEVTIFACGHESKAVSERCELEKTARRFGLPPNPHSSNGFIIARSNTVSTTCGRGHVDDSPYSCDELVILQPFFAHKKGIKEEFDDYKDRIELVADCSSLMNDAGGIECDWSLIPVAELKDTKDLYDIHWNSALPGYIATAQQATTTAFEHLELAHKYTVDVLLGCLVAEFPPGLDIEINIWDRETNESEGMGMYRQIVRQVRDKVRVDLDMLEELAVRACLDGVGWSLPIQDPEATKTLLGWVLERQVKPVYGAIRVEEWMEPSVEREVEADVDVKMEDLVDPLDTAEMDQGWGYSAPGCTV